MEFKIFETVGGKFGEITCSQCGRQAFIVPQEVAQSQEELLREMTKAFLDYGWEMKKQNQTKRWTCPDCLKEIQDSAQNPPSEICQDKIRGNSENIEILAKDMAEIRQEIHGSTSFYDKKLAEIIVRIQDLEGKKNEK